MTGHTTGLRWHLKKAGRKGVVLRPIMPGAASQPGVRVLTYHRFGSSLRDPFCVSVEAFDQQMAWLASQGLSVSLADVEAFLAGHKALADTAILVTIDDGFESLHSQGLPILKRHGISAVAFVPAGELDSTATHTPADLPERRMTWQELQALNDAGIAIGSHAWTHRSLGRRPVHEIRDEAERSRCVLENRLGRAVTAFAYPYGTRADYDATAATIVRQAGYTCAFTSQHGAIRPGLDAFTLPRVKVEGGEALWVFRRLCRGGLDAWRWIDHALWRLQARGQTNRRPALMRGGALS